MTGTGGAGTGGTTVMPCPTCSLEVQAWCKDGNLTNGIKVWLKIQNKTTMATPYANIKLRYWYRLDNTTVPQVMECDYAQLGCTNTASPPVARITATFNAVTPAKPQANQYAEISFAANSGTLSSNGNSGEIQLRIHGNPYTDNWNLSQMDDYSYAGCPTTAYGAWDHITAYVGGTLVAGVEP
jgi:hypothetical protein